MSEVKRYRQDQSGELCPSQGGDYMLHSDYLALRQERDELVNVLSLMLADVESYRDNPGGHAPLHHVASAHRAIEKAGATAQG